jgi:hypothetical protein
MVLQSANRGENYGWEGDLTVLFNILPLAWLCSFGDRLTKYCHELASTIVSTHQQSVYKIYAIASRTFPL